MKSLSLIATSLLMPWALFPVVHTLQYTEELSKTQLESILNGMSVSDKINHMAQIDFSMLFTNDKIDFEKIKYYFGELGIGSLLIVPYKQEYLTASAYRSIMLAIQNATKTYNRPPVIAGIDSVHGANYINGATIFPQPINIACTWDENNAKSVASFGAKETLAAGIPWMFSPIVGLGIYPSWSRMYETFGEDPYLVGIFARAMVEGIQQSGVAACAKHFVGYSAPRDGHDRSPSWIPTRHLYQYFVRPWREVIGHGNVLTIMESYTEYDGVPNVANRNSLVTLLRQDLGFDGVLITDYQEIENLIGFHKVALDYDEAVKMTLMEGSVDMNMIPFNVDGWSNSVKHNFEDAAIHDVVRKRIDDSVLRILQLKNNLGMFHTDLKEDDLEIGKVGSKGRRDVALDIARESIVLTKNDDGTLPLHNSNHKKLKVHVTGPTCDSLGYQSGGWTIAWQGASDYFFEYGQTVLGAATHQSQWDVTSSCGVNIMGDSCDGDNQDIANEQRLGADYIIVCIGEENYTEKPGDIRDLNLPQGQRDFVKQLKNESQAKIIVIYFGGRPRLLDDIVDSADSILIAFLPGPDAGQAVVEIITGEQNPSGRLPITYPKYQDGGGIPYWHTVSDQCTESNNPHEPLPHWIYSQCEVQWPFGYGLSYTSFKYTNLELDSKTMTYSLPWSDNGKSSSNSIKVSINVQNTGSRPSFETIMLFLFVESRHVTPEYKQLIGYKRRKIDPGQTITQQFEVTTDMLRYVGPHDEKHDILQMGQKFRLGIGPTTDCRTMQANELCTEMLTLEFNGQGIYEPSCEAACILLENNGCLAMHKLSGSECYSICRSSHSPNDIISLGWGWNYLNCIETILLTKSRSNERKCYDVDNMCRNVFASKPTLDNEEEEGISIQDQSRTRPPLTPFKEDTKLAKYNIDTVVMSILAGVVGTLIIVYPFYRNVIYSFDAKKGKDEIAFSPISRNEVELEII